MWRPLCVGEMGQCASPNSSQAPPIPSAPTSTISPGILLAIVVAAAVFFVSGVLRLLVRCLLRPARGDPEEDLGGATVRQGQLQQLFHLHDAGVDQSFIDALPIFLYGAVVGPKEDGAFDCAVCLCEFQREDRLRLLPRCSHAFHLDCIDTWLLAHSTCPLCRGSLAPDPAPAVLVLESGRAGSSREVAVGGDGSRQPGHLEEDQEPAASSIINDAAQKSGESAPAEEALVAVGETPQNSSALMVLPVKLGKFRNVEASAREGEEAPSSTRGGNCVDGRRCFSMGSFEYVMDDTSLLQVAIRPPAKKPSAKRPGHRPAMSELDGRAEGLKLFQPAKTTVEPRGEDAGGTARVSAGSRQRDSFSISKVWLRPTKENAAAVAGSRRAFSFRLSLQQWRPPAPEKGRGEQDLEVEGGECGSRVVSRAEETPSFARRTLLWMVGRHHRVGSHV